MIYAGVILVFLYLVFKPKKKPAPQKPVQPDPDIMKLVEQREQERLDAANLDRMLRNQGINPPE